MGRGRNERTGTSSGAGEPPYTASLHGSKHVVAIATICMAFPADVRMIVPVKSHGTGRARIGGIRSIADTVPIHSAWPHGQELKEISSGHVVSDTFPVATMMEGN